MANKRLWLGMLVIALVFGMTVVGCAPEEKEEDTNPSPPTGLTGTVISPNNSIRLSWNSVNNANEYRIQYKKSSSSGDYLIKYGIKTTNYTFSDLDYTTKYDFKVAAQNTDYNVSDYSSPITVETGNPLTGNVSVSMETRCLRSTNFLATTYYYSAVIKLTLSDGAYWDRVDTIDGDLFKSWVTMSGTPDVSAWNVGLYDYSLTPRPQKIQFSYGFTSTTNNISISGLTATIVTSKLTEMKGYTNVVNSLTSGTPSSASSSEWESL